MTAWADRLTERSPIVQRSRDRSIQQATVLLEAALRLAATKGENFTTQDLVKEAGVALQTFYRYFASKDELLLAVIETMIADACDTFAARAAGIDDPLLRLRSHIRSVIGLLGIGEDGLALARFVAAEHWRLSRLFPAEMTKATQPFTDLLRGEIEAATEAGTLLSTDPGRDAWLTTQLVLSVFHQHAFAGSPDPDLVDDLWRFCLGALGGERPAAPSSRPRSEP